MDRWCVIGYFCGVGIEFIATVQLYLNNPSCSQLIFSYVTVVSSMCSDSEYFGLCCRCTAADKASPSACSVPGCWERTPLTCTSPLSDIPEGQSYEN